MRIYQLLCAVVLGGMSFATLACEYTDLPDIPEFSRKAGPSDREKQKIDEDVVRYTNAMASYVACVRAEIDQAEAAGAAAFALSLLVSRNNSAIEELKAVHALYTDRIGPVEALFDNAGNAR